MLNKLNREYFSRSISLIWEILLISLPVVSFLVFPWLLPYRTLYILFSFAYIYLFFQTTKISLLDGLKITRINLKKSVVWALAYTAFSVLILLFFLLFYPEVKNLSLILPDLNNLPFSIFILLYVFISVPLQELIFRGFFITRLKLIFSDVRIVVFLSALFFMLAHAAFGQLIILPFAFVFGILLGLIMIKTENIIGPAIYHALTGVSAFLLIVV